MEIFPKEIKSKKYQYSLFICDCMLQIILLTQNYDHALPHDKGFSCLISE